MASETTVAIAILMSVGSLVAAVQFLPPLTSYEAPAAQKSRENKQNIDNHAWCRANMPGIDCGCFSDRAGEIMAEDNPRVQGWSFADKWQLAKAQAGDGCS